MLKLTYQTNVFGSIDFEYDRPVLRVGSDPANDLVLGHHSVSPFHCVLLFRSEKIVWVPPQPDDLSETDFESLTGPEFRAGDRLQIGELEFLLERSSRSVELHRSEPVSDESPSAENCTHYCPNCRRFIPEHTVKRVGLVGQPKRELCPQCSRLLEVVLRP